jgi:branched-chain amino acid transport system substrate-binding protein
MRPPINQRPSRMYTTSVGNDAISAPAMLEALREAEIEPDGYVLPAHAAMEVAVIAIAAAENSGEPLEAVLFERAFPTVVGPVSFDELGDMEGLDFRLYRHDGSQFAPVEQ